MEICNETIAERVVYALKSHGYHITTAESCTGGMVASMLVDVSGASQVFEEGYITYSNPVKEKVLGVQAETLSEFTEVSGAVAEEMALGAAKTANADISVSITGYAGPGPAENGTKAGTVYIGTWFQGQAESRLFSFEGDRQAVRQQAAEQALLFVLERLQKSE